MPLFGRKKTEDPASLSWTREPLPPPPEPRADGLRSMEDHREYLLSCLEVLPGFSQHVLDALDLSICEDIYAGISMPRFDNSAMDGYAVRAADVAGAADEAPVILPVVGGGAAAGAGPADEAPFILPGGGEVAAGQDTLHRLPPRTAIKIMTGAPLPPDA